MKGYFLIADVLGFSNVVSNLQPPELDKHIGEWISIAQEAQREAGVEKMQLFSDTLFAQEEDSLAGLRRLLRLSQALLEMGIAQSFPIRGAITYGEVIWGELTYGKPIVDAHLMERSLDWIGIACDPSLPRIESLWSWDIVCNYLLPLKSGPVQSGPAVTWKVPDPNSLVLQTINNGLSQPQDRVEWKWESKLNHTIEFREYLRNASQAESMPAVFAGEHHPSPIWSGGPVGEVTVLYHSSECPSE